jgi:hypothetical protein
MGAGTERRRRRGRRWTALPVLGLVVLAGCASSTSLPSVTVLGDSGAAVQQTDLARTLDPPYTPTYLIRYGGRIGEMSSVLSNAIRHTGNPGVAIVNLGTTQALRGGPQQTGSPLQPLVSATSGVPCVVLTTVNVKVDNGPGGLAAQINHEIKLLALSKPTKYKVVDWNEFLSTLPPPSLPTYLQANDRLETPAGAQWLATADLAGVHACGTTHQPTVIGPNPD